MSLSGEWAARATRVFKTSTVHELGCLHFPVEHEAEGGREAATHSGASYMGAEAENRVVIMPMAFMEPVTPWEKQELWKVHLKPLYYQFEGL